MSKSIVRLISSLSLLAQKKPNYKIIYTSEAVILGKGEIVGTQKLHYCVATLIIGERNYAFMHFEGQKNKVHDEELLRQTLSDLIYKYEEKNLSATIYSLPNYDSDDFFVSAKMCRDNVDNVKGILNGYNIKTTTLFGSAREIVVNKDCRIVSALKHKFISSQTQLS